MVAVNLVNNTIPATTTATSIIRYRNDKLKTCPADYERKEKRKAKEHDRLRKNDSIKTKIDCAFETAMEIPEYAARGMKGDQDFNFYEYLKVAKIPYYIGGLGLAAICLAGRNSNVPHDKLINSQIFKKVLSGVLMYYVAREMANAVINIPVKLFRGIDLNKPYRRITDLREGNPDNLPNDKRPSNQSVFDSNEFTRWDLLYATDTATKKKGLPANHVYAELAKEFGAEHDLNCPDSKVKRKVRELLIMASSWKYMLSAPFVMLGLGMAQQDSFQNINFKEVFLRTVNLIGPYEKNKFSKLGNSIVNNIYDPIKNSVIELWKGKSKLGGILGKTAIIGSVGLTILANAMILQKTSLRGERCKTNGGNK